MTQPNILQINIEEPTSNPAQPSTHHILADDLNEAEKRYRSLIHVLISQLTGLNDTHVRFIVSPAEPEAIDAVSFWILPLFRGKVIKHGHHFHFTPEQNAPEFTIEFTTDENSATTNFQKSAKLSAHCPQCSSRWINAAMMQCNENTLVKGEHYLTIQHQKLTSSNIQTTQATKLPELPVIHTALDWEQAMDSPIGPKLKKFHHEL